MREKLLNELKLNMKQYVSGEEFSRKLGVSRTAVWKHINELKKEGYEIESSSKKGYRLLSVPDIINTHEIGYHLETEVIGKKILYFDTIDSTNNYAKKIALDGCEDGTVVVADSQSGGRGRRGRQWNSAGGKGIWMSVILKPRIDPEEAQIITIAASVAVVEALKSSAGIEARIKWPNDIILDSKKVCGILTEMNSEMERINFLVLGMGINVSQEEGDFPPDIRDSAVSLKSHSKVNFNRSEIIKNVLYELERNYSKINKGFASQIIDAWREYTLTLGKEVRVIFKGSEYTGIASDIANDGRLIVRCSDGVTREVLSGEVSVRGVLGYV